ncbi:MAG: hypothetical protein PVF49_09645 [Anaerolineales bacterium]|jgi:hypothetical protein
MAEHKEIEKLLHAMPIEKAGADLVPDIHAALSTARRRARLIAGALRAGVGLLSLITALALVPRIATLLELLPSDWMATATEWWSGLERTPVESLKSLGLQLWSLPNDLAQSVGIEIVLGGLVALLLSWLTFKIILAGQVSRKAVLQ